MAENQKTQDWIFPTLEMAQDWCMLFSRAGSDHYRESVNQRLFSNALLSVFLDESDTSCLSPCLSIGVHWHIIKVMKRRDTWGYIKHKNKRISRLESTPINKTWENLNIYTYLSTFYPKNYLYNMTNKSHEKWFVYDLWIYLWINPQIMNESLSS